MKKRTILILSISVLVLIILVISFIFGCSKKNEKNESDVNTDIPNTECEEITQNTESETVFESETTEPEVEETTEAPEITNVPATELPKTEAKTEQKAKPWTEPKKEPEPVTPEPEPTYINGILIANKTYPLPSTYNPGVDTDAKNALVEMFTDAAKESVILWVSSGFRSYKTQEWLYNTYVKVDGQELADTYSARPGHSEHQTGLAFDINHVEDWFADTPEGKWLAENCWKYGFIIRYPKGKEEQTGYKYEPWHIRYLGKDMAKSVYESGLCLEEYLGITSYYA